MTTNRDRQQLMAWLNDAYMMEKSLEEVLLKHINDFQEDAEWRERLLQHVDETRLHAARVRKCIEQLGGAPSLTKTIAGELMGRVEGLSTAMFPDELVKNAIAEYTSEHMEIACYAALVAAAEEVFEPHVAEVCREILAQEESMAAWLIERIPQLTRRHVASQMAAA